MHSFLLIKFLLYYQVEHCNLEFSSCVLVTWRSRILICIHFIYIGYNKVFYFMIIVFIAKKRYLAIHKGHY
jgi:hypothetical protein